MFSEYKIFSSRPSSSFGHALKLADMNGDGVDDLVIGAPSYYDEAAGFSRVQGCVFVVLVLTFTSHITSWMKPQPTHERCFFKGFLDANGQRLPAGDIEEVCMLVGEYFNARDVFRHQGYLTFGGFLELLIVLKLGFVNKMGVACHCNFNQFNS